MGICLTDLQLALRSAIVMMGSPQTLFSKFFHVKQLSIASGMTAINPSRIAFTYITRDHSFSKYANFSEKTNISYPLIRTRTCACQEVRNVSFSKILRTYVKFYVGRKKDIE